MRFCELKEKDIVNRCDCKRLGRASDFVFDEKSGAICAVVVQGPNRLLGFLSPDQEYIIPWKCICQIGPDIILVEIHEEETLTPRKIWH
ncbi:MAG: YlmC/YmxH family sporulation protein [Lachnospiraceae bacterium]|nr:YlmC/YmxH family sporulation protein [Lachnospiraceae bacterium]